MVKRASPRSKLVSMPKSPKWDMVLRIMMKSHLGSMKYLIHVFTFRLQRDGCGCCGQPYLPIPRAQILFERQGKSSFPSVAADCFLLLIQSLILRKTALIWNGEYDFRNDLSKIFSLMRLVRKMHYRHGALKVY